VRPPFSILKTRHDESLHWVEGAQTLEAAKQRIAQLARFWPGKYVTLNEATVEKVCITMDDATVHEGTAAAFATTFTTRQLPGNRGSRSRPRPVFSVRSAHRVRYCRSPESF
jgi:hypothetical protein